MTYPRTILEIAGVPARPARLDTATLIVMDVQGEYATGPLQLDGAEEAVRHLVVLLAAARAAGTRIVHVAQSGRAGQAFDPASARGAFLPEIVPRPDETVLSKSRPDAFSGTQLADLLATIGRRDIIIAGFMTHLCVSSTARVAFDMGYRVTIAADACATRSLPDTLAHAAIPDTVVHRVALAELADRCAVVARVAEIVAPH